MFNAISNNIPNRLSGAMVSVLASRVVDLGFEPNKSKTIKLVFVASPQSTQGERAKTGWLGIRGRVLKSILRFVLRYVLG